MFLYASPFIGVPGRMRDPKVRRVIAPRIFIFLSMNAGCKSLNINVPVSSKNVFSIIWVSHLFISITSTVFAGAMDVSSASDFLTVSPALLASWEVSTALAIALLFIVTYMATSLKSVIAIRGKKDGREPPIVPYWIPILGNLIPLVWNTAGFTSAFV